MNYRTKTYLAAAWTEESDAIEQLFKWNDNDRFSLHFKNVHEYIQSRDSSYPCSIKKSLSERMDISKIFVLIVGNNTNAVRKGSCIYCQRFKSNSNTCYSNMNQNYKSYIEYECDRAKRDFLDRKLQIIVLYNSCYVIRDRCPESIRDYGIHVAMKINNEYDYKKVLRAFFYAELNAN